MKQFIYACQDGTKLYALTIEGVWIKCKQNRYDTNRRSLPSARSQNINVKSDG